MEINHLAISSHTTWTTQTQPADTDLQDAYDKNGLSNNLCTLKFRVYPSSSDTTMLLLRAPQADYTAPDAARDLDAFAQYASTDGLTRVMLPQPQPHTQTEINACVLDVCCALPDEPVIVGKVDAQNTLDLDAVSSYFGNFPAVPAWDFLKTRDGSAIAYRYFGADTNTIVILMHGAGSHAVPYSPLAQFLSGHNLAQVYAVNLRGHYLSGTPRGDVKYIGQMEDDLADLIRHIRAHTHNTRIVLAGHSWGGGLVIRFAGGKYAPLIAGGILMAPYPGPALSVFRHTGDGGWAKCLKLRVAGLCLLNLLRMQWLNHLPVVKLDLPPVVLDMMATTAYSYRAFASFSPRWLYWQNLERIRQPLLVLLGAEDGIFDDTRLSALIKQHTAAEVHVIPKATHMGIVFHKQSHTRIADWLQTSGKTLAVIGGREYGFGT